MPFLKNLGRAAGAFGAGASGGLQPVTGGPQSRNSKLGMLAGAASSALAGDGMPRPPQAGGINTGPSPMNQRFAQMMGPKLAPPPPMAPPPMEQPNIVMPPTQLPPEMQQMPPGFPPELMNGGMGFRRPSPGTPYDPRRRY
jgi:hypothetical protein